MGHRRKDQRRSWRGAASAWARNAKTADRELPRRAHNPPVCAQPTIRTEESNTPGGKGPNRQQDADDRDERKRKAKGIHDEKLARSGWSAARFTRETGRSAHKRLDDARGGSRSAGGGRGGQPRAGGLARTFPPGSAGRARARSSRSLSPLATAPHLHHRVSTRGRQTPLDAPLAVSGATRNIRAGCSNSSEPAAASEFLARPRGTRISRRTAAWPRSRLRVCLGGRRLRSVGCARQDRISAAERLLRSTPLLPGRREPCARLPLALWGVSRDRRRPPALSSASPSSPEGKRERVFDPSAVAAPR